MFGAEEREQRKSRSSVTGKSIEPSKRLLHNTCEDKHDDVRGLTGAEER